MNSLLLRQIRKHLPADLLAEKRLENFFSAINQSYANYEDQLKMSQRAMIISSDELFQANKKLREDAEIQKGIIENLNYIVRILKLGDSSENELDIDGKVDLAKFINKQSKEILKINKQREELLVNLEFKNQELNNYAHIVSHDLKTPLRSIDSLVNWIIENDKNTTIETDVMSEEEIAMIDDDNFEARLFEMQQRILW